ncbi:hypothetical protein [Streptomyces sp. NPDC003717]|uniref:Rv1733c family protein n=1 Tax=Streptomyces sp. NPDC003717 TaxID=3154276 RepID=UPI0033ABC90D
MRTRVRGWRWRHNPLRRRSDVVEAWTAVAVAVLLFVGAPLAGAAAAWWGHDQARDAARQQLAERHRVSATVVGPPPAALPTVQAGGQHAYRATVRWTAPGGARPTTAARVPAGTRPGDTVRVWLDSRGRAVPPPADGAVVWQHTLTLGVCAAASTALVVLLAQALVRRVTLRRRLAEWERAWAGTEPHWTHRRPA